MAWIVTATAVAAHMLLYASLALVDRPAARCALRAARHTLRMHAAHCAHRTVTCSTLRVRSVRREAGGAVDPTHSGVLVSRISLAHRRCSLLGRAARLGWLDLDPSPAESPATEVPHALALPSPRAACRILHASAFSPRLAGSGCCAPLGQSRAAIHTDEGSWLCSH